LQLKLKMPSTRCCVYACNANGGHKFPKELNRRKLWTIAARRANWQPTDTSVKFYTTSIIDM